MDTSQVIAAVIGSNALFAFIQFLITRHDQKKNTLSKHEQAQNDMIIGLGHIFDISLSETAAKSILGGTMASQTGRAVFSGIIKGIPGVGTVVGGVISAGTSVALTETLGWIVAEDFYKKSLDPTAESVLDTANTVMNGFNDFTGSVNSQARASAAANAAATAKKTKKRFF